jgi:hypothetical protein
VLHRECWAGGGLGGCAAGGLRGCVCGGGGGQEDEDSDGVGQEQYEDF